MQNPIHVTAMAMPTLKSQYAKRIYLVGWTKYDHKLKAIRVFSSLFEGNYPIENASVTAIITSPSGKKINVRFRDSGSWYPDTARGDGIPSAYSITSNFKELPKKFL